MLQLCDLLDEANIKYIWFVFTNGILPNKPKNMIMMQPRLDIRPFLLMVKGKGYGVQLSDTERRLFFYKGV